MTDANKSVSRRHNDGFEDSTGKGESSKKWSENKKTISFIYIASMVVSVVSLCTIIYNSESLRHALQNLKVSSNPSWVHSDKEPLTSKWGLHLINIIVSYIVVMLCFLAMMTIRPDCFWTAVAALAVSVFMLGGAYLATRFDSKQSLPAQAGLPTEFNATEVNPTGGLFSVVPVDADGNAIAADARASAWGATFAELVTNGDEGLGVVQVTPGTPDAVVGDTVELQDFVNIYTTLNYTRFYKAIEDSTTINGGKFNGTTYKNTLTSVRRGLWVVSGFTLATCGASLFFTGNNYFGEYKSSKASPKNAHWMTAGVSALGIGMSGCTLMGLTNVSKFHTGAVTF
jgi:hypothetical protein